MNGVVNEAEAQRESVGDAPWVGEEVIVRRAREGHEYAVPWAEPLCEVLQNVLLISKVACNFFGDAGWVLPWPQKNNPDRQRAAAFVIKPGGGKVEPINGIPVFVDKDL